MSHSHKPSAPLIHRLFPHLDQSQDLGELAPPLSASDWRLPVEKPPVVIKRRRLAAVEAASASAASTPAPADPARAPRVFRVVPGPATGEMVAVDVPAAAARPPRRSARARPERLPGPVAAVAPTLAPQSATCDATADDIEAAQRRLDAALQLAQSAARWTALPDPGAEWKRLADQAAALLAELQALRPALPRIL